MFRFPRHQVINCISSRASADINYKINDSIINQINIQVEIQVGIQVIQIRDQIPIQSFLKENGYSSK